ncbi:hypothetical protein MRBBS_0301 [Marinobacter sp. BSs20148]|nr:hypothetical protein MRBBS_0301 [Marinobacter sp. BSs20148]
MQKAMASCRRGLALSPQTASDCPDRWPPEPEQCAWYNRGQSLQPGQKNHSTTTREPTPPAAMTTDNRSARLAEKFGNGVGAWGYLAGSETNMGPAL